MDFLCSSIGLGLVINTAPQILSSTLCCSDRLNPSPLILGGLPYGAAMKVIGNEDRQETGHWKNNCAENSHLPFRRRERVMLRFRRTRILQKFLSVHSSIHNHFNLERHLYSRSNFKLNRAAALSEWRQFGVAYRAAPLSLQRLVRIRLTAPSAPFHILRKPKNFCAITK